MKASFGNWSILYMLGTFLLTQAMFDVGLIRRITLWFITRNFAKKSPWHLTVMFLVAVFDLVVFIDSTACCILMLMIAHEVIEAFGFEKGDEWPCMLIMAIPIVVNGGYAGSPIGHPPNISVMNVVSALSGQQMDIVLYLGAGIPASILFCVLFFLYMKLFVKPDLSQFKNADYSKLDAMRPVPMTKQEKVTAFSVLLVLIGWVLPGIIALFDTSNALYLFLSKMTLLYPTLVGVALLAVIRIDGKPVLDVKDALTKIS